MFMFKARIAAERRLARAYQETGLTAEEVRAFLDKNPKYASPLHHAPHKVAGSAANLVYEVAPLIKQTALERAQNRGRKALTDARDLLTQAPGTAVRLAKAAADLQLHDRLRQDYALVKNLLQGKVKERFGPLVERLAGKAYFENNPEVSHVVHEAIAAE